MGWKSLKKKSKVVDIEEHLRKKEEEEQKEKYERILARFIRHAEQLDW